MLVLMACAAAWLSYPVQAASVASSENVFVGEVLRIGDCPVAKSGFVLSAQDVDFRVQRTLKGRVPQLITVSFPVRECLDNNTFNVGARLLVSTSPIAPSAIRYAGLDASPIDSREALALQDLLQCPASKASSSPHTFSNLTVSSDRKRLEVVTTANMTATLGPDFFSAIANSRFYEIVRLDPSPTKQMVAITLAASTPGNRYCVVLKASCLLPETIDTAHSPESGSSFGARDVVWLGDQELAFLEGSYFQTSQRVFVKTLSTKEYRSTVVRDTPSSLQSARGRLSVTYDDGSREFVRLPSRAERRNE